MITAVKILLEISDIKHFGIGKLDDTGILRVHYDIQHFKRIMRNVFLGYGSQIGLL